MDLIALVDVVTRELMLFAAVGMLIGGIDDLAVDALFVIRRLFGYAPSRLAMHALPIVAAPSRLAIFVPAWDEAGVVDRMIETTLMRLDHGDYRLYVGTYPNDPATIGAVRLIAERDARVRLVVGTHGGPTTKADCLNTLWRALMQADAADRAATRAVIIHDAEDIVHPDELRIIDALLTTHQVVQLPVLPLIQQNARMVAGVHADEFAESHSRAMVVRTALGAAMPLAGTGCAIDVDWLRRVADERGGIPFDADSLVEDYELCRAQDNKYYPGLEIITRQAAKSQAPSLVGVTTYPDNFVGRKLRASWRKLDQRNRGANRARLVRRGDQTSPGLPSQGLFTSSSHIASTSSLNRWSNRRS